MARFASEEERIKNALTPTNRDLLNHIRNAEMAAGLRIHWVGREKILEVWESEFIDALREWDKLEDEDHPTPKEYVYILLAAAQKIQDDILQEEKS